MPDEGPLRPVKRGADAFNLSMVHLEDKELDIELR